MCGDDIYNVCDVHNSPESHTCTSIMIWISMVSALQFKFYVQILISTLSLLLQKLCNRKLPFLLVISHYKLSQKNLATNGPSTVIS